MIFQLKTNCVRCAWSGKKQEQTFSSNAIRLTNFAERFQSALDTELLASIRKYASSGIVPRTSRGRKNY